MLHEEPSFSELFITHLLVVVSRMDMRPVKHHSRSAAHSCSSKIAVRPLR